MDNTFKPIEKEDIPEEISEGIESENPVVEWNDSFVFDPMKKDFVLTPILQDRIGKLALEGATDEEICLFCNISTKVWKNYLRENELFADWIKRLREKTTFIARRNINFAIQSGNLELSRWKLEKEAKKAEKQNQRDFDLDLPQLTADDESILEAYVTRTVTLKKTTKIPFTPVQKQEKIIND